MSKCYAVLAYPAVPMGQEQPQVAQKVYAFDSEHDRGVWIALQQARGMVASRCTRDQGRKMQRSYCYMHVSIPCTGSVIGIVTKVRAVGAFK